MKSTVTLKKNYEFGRVYKKGRFFAGRFLILYVMKNNREIKRIGISVSKKVGKSVKRNRLRRLVRESYSFYEDFVQPGNDLVFVARASDQMPLFMDIKKEMKFLLKKLKVFDQEKWDCLKNCL